MAEKCLQDQKFYVFGNHHYKLISIIKQFIKMENQELITISEATSLMAINKSEIDVQVATAHAYPRNVPAVLNEIESLATLDTDTAADCFYVLRRGESFIEGLSVRMAEIIASSWGNLRIGTRIIGNDGKKITAQAVCIDLQKNVAVSLEVQKGITYKNGKTYSDDMQVVTGNAASAIAFRNAVLKVIPKVVTKKVVDRVREVAMGKALDLETSRANLVQYFSKLGVTLDQLFSFLNISKLEQIDKEMVYELRSTANAIKEGTTTVEETFIKPAIEKEMAKKAQETASKAKKKAEEALAKIKKENAAEAKFEENNDGSAETK